MCEACRLDDPSIDEGSPPSTPSAGTIKPAEQGEGARPSASQASHVSPRAGEASAGSRPSPADPEANEESKNSKAGKNTEHVVFQERLASSVKSGRDTTEEGVRMSAMLSTNSDMLIAHGVESFSVEDFRSEGAKTLGEAPGEGQVRSASSHQYRGELPPISELAEAH